MTNESVPAVHPRLVADALRRRWRIVVATVLVGVVAGVFVASTRPVRYVSTETLIINPLEGNAFSPASIAQRSDANTDTLTEARIAATQAVADLAERTLGLPPGSVQWEHDLSVSVVPNTQVLAFTYTTTSASQAPRLADAMGKAFLAYRAQRFQDSIAKQLAMLDQRSSAIQKTLSAASQQLNASTARGDRTILSQQVANYTAQLSAIATETATMSSANRDPGQVLTPAGAARPVGVARSLLIAGAGLVALVVGVFAALAREWADTRVRGVDVIESTGVPVFAVFDERRPPGRRRAGESERDARETFRVLRTVVTARAAPPCEIAVLPVARGRGADVTDRADHLVVGLAEALARSAYDVTAVFTTEAGQVSGDVPAGPRHGLDDVLLDGLDPLLARSVIAPHLSVLLAGDRIDAATELFATPALAGALDALAGLTGYVLVSGPHALSADAHALAASTSCTLLLCELHETRLSELRTAVGELHRVGARVVGVIAVTARRRRKPRAARRRLAQPVLVRSRTARAPESDARSMPGAWPSPRPPDEAAPALGIAGTSDDRAGV